MSGGGRGGSGGSGGGSHAGESAGSAPPRWRAGDTLPDRTLPPVERDDLVRYADASGDRNPIHLDDEAARAAGLPSVVQHGMLTMAQVGRLFSPFLEHGVVRSFTTRFVGTVVPGDRLTVRARITGVETSDTGDRLYTFDVDATVEGDRTVAAGSVEFLVWDDAEA